MTNINAFQLLIKLGLPSDIASLICSTGSVSMLGDPTELANFMVNQKLKQTGTQDGTAEPEWKNV